MTGDFVTPVQEENITCGNMSLTPSYTSKLSQKPHFLKPSKVLVRTTTPTNKKITMGKTNSSSRRSQKRSIDGVAVAAMYKSDDTENEGDDALAAARRRLSDAEENLKAEEEKLEEIQKQRKEAEEKLKATKKILVVAKAKAKRDAKMKAARDRQERRKKELEKKRSIQDAMAREAEEELNKYFRRDSS